MRTLASLCLILACLPGASADISCPPIIGDHMVLQQGRPVVLWGTGAPGESVTAAFAGATARAVVDASGAWRLVLPPQEASSESRPLRIKGANTLEFSDVLVGEVWLCSGQSNMEKPLGPRKGQKPTDNYEEHIAKADHPRLRLFQVPQYGRPKPGQRGLAWVACSPESLRETDFSAAGYFFGRDIHERLEVPVGLVHASFGGTQIEAWTPRASYEAEARLRDLLDVRYFAWVEGVQVTELFQSMIAPLAPYTLRGFLWYQGEANCMNGDTAIYADKMRALVGGWREVWEDELLPFYFALLAPFNYSKWDSFPRKLTARALPLFWEAQVEAALQLPNADFIVTTDLAGDARDIHPTNKLEVGKRFAGLALNHTYGRNEIRADSPRVAGARNLGHGRIEVRFSHADGGLATSDHRAPTEFEVAGADRQFHSAQAEIDGNTVLVRSEAVAFPQAVRFAWRETARSNLVNAAGLPVVPFRTDRWPVENLRSEAPDQ